MLKPRLLNRFSRQQYGKLQQCRWFSIIMACITTTCRLVGHYQFVADTCCRHLYCRWQRRTGLHGLASYTTKAPWTTWSNILDDKDPLDYTVWHTRNPRNILNIHLFENLNTRTSQSIHPFTSLFKVGLTSCKAAQHLSFYFKCVRYINIIKIWSRI